MTPQTHSIAIKNGKKIALVVILLMASYFIYDGINGLMHSNLDQQNWTPKDHLELVNKCMIDANDMAEKFPTATKEYCDCSMYQIEHKFSKSEYAKILQKSQADQVKTVLPVIQTCLNEYQQKIK